MPRIALLYLIITGPAITLVGEAITATVRTLTGVTYMGTLAGLSDNVVEINLHNHNASRSIGIPLDQIDLIVPVATKSTALIEVLEPYACLFEHLDNRSLDTMCGEVVNLCQKGDFLTAYKWTNLLSPHLRTAQGALNILIHQAWALYEMGMLKRARGVVSSLQDQVDPLTADTRYCWLMANLALLENDSEAAVYWSQIPALQIPAKNDSLAIELSERYKEWNAE